MPASTGYAGPLPVLSPMQPPDALQTDLAEPLESTASVESPAPSTGPHRPIPPERPLRRRIRGAQPAAPQRVTHADEEDDLGEGVPDARSRSRSAIRRRLLATADLVAAAAAFVIVVSLLGQDSLGLGAAIAIAAVVPICKLADLYDRDEHLLHKTTLDEAPALFRVAALYTLVAFLAGAAIVEGTFGREQALFFWGLLFVLMVLMRAVSRWVSGLLVEPERCLVLGSAEIAHRLGTQLDRCVGPEAEIVGRVPLGPSDGGSNELPVLGRFEALGPLLGAHRIDRTIIAPSMHDGDHRLLDAIRVVKRLGVQISVLPSLLEVVGSAYELDQIEGSTLLGLRRHGLSRSSRLLKRGFDIAGSALLLLVLAPLLAMIAVAIKLDSRGPVFFRQRRVGMRDMTFEIFKFRTMIDGADAQRAALAHRNEAGGGLFKIEADPRVTRVGRFLRRTSLDELAQLLNVLRGEMSLVGPRPLVVDEDRLIQGLHRHRLLVPPGVTGLWQIYGSARIPLDEMVKIDYLYGANWSLWLDTKILLRTVPFVLARRGL
jgi:exopolysaccharide biosynthesis polyprenyl glycosylphosphotransferase